MTLSNYPRHPSPLGGLMVPKFNTMVLHCTILVIFIALNIVLAGKGPVSQRRVASSAPPFQFDLQPTGFLDEARQRRRLQSNSSFVIPDEWLRPERSAVYVGIPDARDPRYRHNRQLQEFHDLRHLSRYEQAYRTQNNIDLREKWDEEYSFEDEQKEIPKSAELRNQTAENRLRSHSDKRRRTQEAAPVAGGQYNNYQAVPLAQGYGTHYVNVWVGSPFPQRKTVIVDTGSHYTAFPCNGCQNCGSTHHTDPYFEPKKSASFHQLQCDECRDGITCQDGECRFSQSYTEGSSWDAVQVLDRFYCSGSDIIDSVSLEDQRNSIDFMFGCQKSMTGLFITQLADGIMGMSAHQATLPKQLYDRHMIEHNIFSMCYRRELGTSKRGVMAGSMTIGGISTNLDTSPMVYAKNMAKIGWYTVYVKNIYIRQGGGQSAKSVDPDHRTIKVKMNPAVLNSGKGVIVDSGTTDTYLNKDVAPEFNMAWRQATGQSYSHLPMRLSPEQILELPTVLVQCHAYRENLDPSIEGYEDIPGYAGRLDPSSPNDLLIAIPATSYMDFSPITSMYTSRIYFSETSGGVLGSNTMQGHNVVFDWENGRVGFAESSCTYDKKSVPEVAQDNGYSKDCTVHAPILSTPCIDTVHREICEHASSNIALLGNETWTGIVESAGSKEGVQCTEVARESSSKSVFQNSDVDCNGKGTCEEKRSCQLTCAEAIVAANVSKAPISESIRYDCGDSLWSTCDHGCEQTRIVSAAHTDGICHEEHRFSRPCHIEACARSDPCLVPFLIHTVVGLHGISVSKWTGSSENTFVSALTSVARALNPLETFGEGDVNVLLAIPWHVDEDDPDQGTHVSKPIGTKIILEISIFNNLSNATSTVTSDTDDSSVKGILWNITERIKTRLPDTICNSDDMYTLAKKTLSIKKRVLESQLFIGSLIHEMERIELSDPISAAISMFSPLFHTVSLESENESRVVSSWTIQTTIDDQINYFGPPRPIWHTMLSFIHVVLLTMIFFLILTSAWTLLVSMYEYLLERGWFLRVRKGRHRYSPAKACDDSQTADQELEMADGGNLEMTVQNTDFQSRGGTKAIKRKTSPADREGTIVKNVSRTT